MVMGATARRLAARGRLALAAEAALPDRGDDRLIRLPVAEDVDADLFALVAGDLHVRLDGIALVEDEAGVVFAEAPFAGLGVEVPREVDVALGAALRRGSGPRRRSRREAERLLDDLSDTHRGYYSKSAESIGCSFDPAGATGLACRTPGVHAARHGRESGQASYIYFDNLTDSDALV